MIFWGITPTHGHHSATIFDRTTVAAFHGIVTRFTWTNPHVYIHVETKTEDGELIEWEIETGLTLLGDNLLTISPPRGRLEGWLDKHNHKMEFLRTLTSAIAAVAGLAVFLKVFGVI